MLKNAAALGAACIVAACSTTSGTEATEKRSGFDGGRVVSIAPHGTACSDFVCISLGAQWSQVAGTGAVLEVAILGAYRSITRAELSIDGRVVPLNSGNITTFATPVPGLRESRKPFGVPLQTLRDITQAKRAWVRVYTPEGYMESAVVDGATDSKALHALRRFLAQVDKGA